jgi:plasmid stabilization system protein ParE
MNWQVIWLPDAEQELTDIWLTAPDRAAVTQAAHLINVQLEQDPENAGNPYTNGRRSYQVPPLGVIYRVLKDSQRVEVIHVWRTLPTNGQAP